MSVPTEGPGLLSAVLVAILLLAVAAALGLLARALGRGRIERNHVIGIRIPSLLASDEAWRRGHAAAERPLMRTMIAAGITAVLAVPVQSLPNVYVVLVFGWVAVVLAGLVWSTSAAHRAAKSAEAEPRRDA